MKLYSYFRSSAAYRVRIALNLKSLSYEVLPVNLVNQGGEQHSPAYEQVNAQKLIPSIVVDDGILSQSLAIIEYLEEVQPTPALLPSDPYKRALMRSWVLIIACEIHPLNNLRVLNYLKQSFSIAKEQIEENWYPHWIKAGFDAIETNLSKQRDFRFSMGNDPGLFEVFLVPQVYNAKRYNVDLSVYPKISAINDACMQMPAFIQASPEQQIDAN